MNIEEFETQQQIQYWQQRQAEQQHNRAFIQQSTYGHWNNPAKRVLDYSTGPRVTIAQACRPWLNQGQPAQPTHQSQVTDISQLRADVAGLAGELRRGLAKVYQDADSQTQRAMVKKAGHPDQPTGPRPKLVNPHVMTQASGASEPQLVYSIRDICRRSVGLE